MTCEQCRDALSAAMDGESWPEQMAAADAHLQGCAECRVWQVAANQANRMLRLRPVEFVPDLSTGITGAALDAQPATTARRRRWMFAVLPRPMFWRIALGGLALAQLTLGLSEILGVVHGLHVPDGAGEHLFNESSAWNVALGVGFAGAASWPKLAAGLLPTLGIFAVILLGMSIADLVGGQVGAGRILTHVVLFAGVLVMLMVHRDYQHPQRPASGADDDALYGDGDGAGNAAAGRHPAHRSTPHRRWLRPVGHRAA